MKIIPKEECMGCHACFNACPTGAITMDIDEKGFKTYEINEDICIKCGKCKRVCPVINNEEIENNPKAYACINNDEEERIKSSSGGVFSLLAKNILDKKGVVFGAKFDDKWNVIHDYIEDYGGIDKFRGSKYVQSTIGYSYKKAKEFLEEGRRVLFTGTPCQIEGLKGYLGKDYDNLVTQDIICHGVPSPKVWERYREYRRKKDKKEPQNIFFRNKDNGWTLFNMKFDYGNTNYRKKQQNDLFMQAFLRNTILRDSCYNCHFKKKNRVSDITLADFWGINRILPGFNDNKGTSLVIINSKKGKRIFKEIEKDIKYKEVDLFQAIKYNPAMIRSSKKDYKRDKFFENIDDYDFDKLVKKYTSHQKFYIKIMNKTKEIIKKFLYEEAKR